MSEVSQVVRQVISYSSISDEWRLAKQLLDDMQRVLSQSCRSQKGVKGQTDHMEPDNSPVEDRFSSTTQWLWGSFAQQLDQCVATRQTT